MMESGTLGVTGREIAAGLNMTTAGTTTGIVGMLTGTRTATEIGMLTATRSATTASSAANSQARRNAAGARLLLSRTRKNTFRSLVSARIVGLQNLDRRSCDDTETVATRVGLPKLDSATSVSRTST